MTAPHDDVYRFGVERTVRILVTTGNDVPGYRVSEFLGIVRGVVVRAPSIGQGFRRCSQIESAGQYQGIRRCLRSRAARSVRPDHVHAAARSACRHRHALRRHGVHAGSHRGAGVRHGGAARRRVRRRARRRRCTSHPQSARNLPRRDVHAVVEVHDGDVEHEPGQRGLVVVACRLRPRLRPARDRRDRACG